MAIECNCKKGGACQIHPKPNVIEMSHEPKDGAQPAISPEDKLALKTLEAESLKAQLQAQSVMQQAQQTQMQLQQFAAAIYEKLGLKQDEWVLDLSKLAFTPRQPKP